MPAWPWYASASISLYSLAFVAGCYLCLRTIFRAVRRLCRAEPIHGGLARPGQLVPPP